MPAKKIAIIQSNYIPWKGYFDIIGSVDEFIVYDEVQYTKNDWRNRNRIKTPQGIQWITVPVFQKNLSQRISETQVSHKRWAVKNWHTIKSNYGKTPFFKEVAPPFEAYYNTTNETFLSQINTTLLRMVCQVLGITTKLSNSTDYTLKGDPTERLVSLCKQSEGQVYLSGPAAKNYLREELFNQEGIVVEWMDYTNYPEYPQLYPPFTHFVSIIDLLFNVGISSPKYMKWNKA